MKGGLAAGGRADTTATAALGTMLTVATILAGGTVLLTRAAPTFGSLRRGAGESRSCNEGEGE